MRREILRTMALGVITLVVALTIVSGVVSEAHAQDAKTPYPNMAPLEQYLTERNTEIALARSAAGLGEAEEGLRLAGALGWFWRTQGRFREGVEYLEAALAREGAQGETLVRARALIVAGELASRQGDHDRLLAGAAVARRQHRR